MHLDAIFFRRAIVAAVFFLAVFSLVSGEWLDAIYCTVLLVAANYALPSGMQKGP